MPVMEWVGIEDLMILLIMGMEILCIIMELVQGVIKKLCRIVKVTGFNGETDV